MHDMSGPVRLILDALASLAMAVASVLMVTLIAVFGWLVYGRYVLNATPTWVEQLALLIVVLITFLAAAVGVWHKSHPSVDFIRDARPGPARRAGRWRFSRCLRWPSSARSWPGRAT